MRNGMSKTSSRELVESFRESYHHGNLVEKTQLLDTIVTATGYDRKYLIRILHGKISGLRGKRTRKSQYGEEFCEALCFIWEACGYICAKRLVPFIPQFVTALEKHGHLNTTAKVREQLMTVSAATADRLLKKERKRIGRGISMTKPGNLLRHQIAVRAANGWHDAVAPGYFEVDLVAHNGGDTRGLFAYTLTMTDIWSGWTDCIAILGKSDGAVLLAVDQSRNRLPMPILAFDSDNGSEFINQKISNFCKDNGITFTRCRPYKKNDQAHVEEKNGSVVRRFTGYARHDSNESLSLLNELYGAIRLFVNYFQPSMKLLEKQRDGAKVRKKYSPAETPCQRLLKSTLEDGVKQCLQDTLAQLDPVDLLSRIKQLQKSLNDLVRLEDAARIEAPADRLALSKKENRRLSTRRTDGVGRPFLIANELKTLAEACLNDDPTLTSTKLAKLINQSYPGSIERGQLPTIKRFVRLWRHAHPEHIESYGPGFLPNKKPTPQKRSLR